MMSSNSLALNSTFLSLAARLAHKLVQGGRSIHPLIMCLLTTHKQDKHSLVAASLGLHSSRGNIHTHLQIVLSVKEGSLFSLEWV